MGVGTLGERAFSLPIHLTEIHTTWNQNKCACIVLINLFLNCAHIEKLVGACKLASTTSGTMIATAIIRKQSQ
jgi:hypothetical protein